jgi:hypothetical protein
LSVRLSKGIDPTPYMLLLDQVRDALAAALTAP